MAPATAEVEESNADPEEDAADEGADEITTQDEVAPLKAAPAPTKLSAADVEEHNITHTPCRSWCDSCVGAEAWRAAWAACWPCPRNLSGRD